MWLQSPTSCPAWLQTPASNQTTPGKPASSPIWRQSPTSRSMWPWSPTAATTWPQNTGSSLIQLETWTENPTRWPRQNWRFWLLLLFICCYLTAEVISLLKWSCNTWKKRPLPQMHRRQCKDTKDHEKLGKPKEIINQIPPKETNKEPIIDPKEVKIYKLCDKEFRIILLYLKKFSKLQEHKR